MKTVLRIGLGIVLGVALVLIGLSAGWALWGRRLWAGWGLGSGPGVMGDGLAQWLRVQAPDQAGDAEAVVG